LPSTSILEATPDVVARVWRDAQSGLADGQDVDVSPERFTAATRQGWVQRVGRADTDAVDRIDRRPSESQTGVDPISMTSCVKLLERRQFEAASLSPQ
jgi:hypothetical protein